MDGDSGENADCISLLSIVVEPEAGSISTSVHWNHKRTGLVRGETMHRHMSTWSRSAVYTNTAEPLWSATPSALPDRTGGQQTCGGCGTRHRRVGCCSVKSRTVCTISCVSMPAETMSGLAPAGVSIKSSRTSCVCGRFAVWYTHFSCPALTGAGLVSASAQQQDLVMRQSSATQGSSWQTGTIISRMLVLDSDGRIGMACASELGQAAHMQVRRHWC